MKVSEIIKKNMLECETFNEKQIERIISDFEKKYISDLSTIFRSHYIRLLNNNKILLIEEFFQLETKDATKKLQTTEQILNAYLKKFSITLNKQIIENIEKQDKRKIAQEYHKKIKEIIEKINDNPNLRKKLNEDIFQRKIYNESNNENQKYGKKSFKNVNLNLNNDELNILGKYLTADIKFEQIENLNKNPYTLLENIYNSINNYILKIKYKEILKENYEKIEDLDLTISEIRALKRYSIFEVADLIEYNEEDFDKLHLSNKRINEIIKKELIKRNIIFFSNMDLIKENIQQENANIKRLNKKL
jgi:hypothetical protein